MVSFRDTAVTDPEAQSLLCEYFEARARDFPGGPAAYVTRFPSPADFEDGHGQFVTAHLDSFEGAIGCGGIRTVDASPHRPRPAEVKHLWVQPRARGLGIGRALVAELERRASDAGATHLVLDTNASQREAESLYRSSGFVEIEPYNDNSNATLWLSKQL